MISFDLTPEQHELEEAARRFAADEIIPVAARHDEEQTFAEDVARKAWELGLLNLEVPREFNGLGLGVLDTCLVLEHAGISAFVFSAHRPGIKKHRLKNKLGQRAADTGEVVFEDLEIPRSALLGAEGDGFKLAMRTFDRSRPEIGAVAIGVSQRALDEATRYARERQQFGQPIAQFQAIQFMLADMAIEVEAMRLLTYKAAWMIDQRPGLDRVELREGLRRGPRHADHDGRGADLRGLRLHEGVPRGEAHGGC